MEDDIANSADIMNTLTEIDEDNKNCADCGKVGITHVSINNGITLCHSCANNHYKFGYEVSFVRNINDPWDEYLLSYMQMGGNSNFKNALAELGVNESLTAYDKYHSNALDFYRRNLKRKVNSQEPLQIDFQDPNKYCMRSKENFTEFKNYHIGILQDEKEAKKHGILKKFGHVLKKGLIGIKHGGKKAFKGIKKAGTFVAHKSKPAAIKIKHGAVFVGSKTKKGFIKLAEKIGLKKHHNKNSIEADAQAGDPGQESQVNIKNNPEENDNEGNGNQENPGNQPDLLDYGDYNDY